MGNPLSERQDHLIFDLSEIDGHGFEEVMETVFSRMGYRAERSKLANDEGRDLILCKDDQVIVVECKHQKASVGRPVVQKLHSATITFPGASRGLLVSTSSFSPGATEYANLVGIEIWDRTKLLQEALNVGVYFAKANKFYYLVPWRSEGEVAECVREQFIRGIKSAPRQIACTVKLDSVQCESVPTLLVDYRVDMTFSTQTGIIHHADAKGRHLWSLEGEELAAVENEYWRGSTPSLTLESEVDGKPLLTYFAAPAEPLVQRTKDSVAKDLSRSVEYVGGNNQVYTKFCAVRPQDVRVQTKQVLCRRWLVTARTGPRSYQLVLADDADRELQVVQTSGFTEGAEGFIHADGILCNECGLISPGSGRGSGWICEDCGMTLCDEHGWRWPDWRLINPLAPCLCSRCYRERDARAEELKNHPALLKNSLLALVVGCIPGLVFLLGRKYAPALFFLLAIAYAVALRNPGVAVLAGLASAIASTYWSWRIVTHGRNMDLIARYKPEWRK